MCDKEYTAFYKGKSKVLVHALFCSVEAAMYFDGLSNFNNTNLH